MYSEIFFAFFYVTLSVCEVVKHSSCGKIIVAYMHKSNNFLKIHHFWLICTGGKGEFSQVRIIASSGNLTAGRQYTIEADFTTHHATASFQVFVQTDSGRELDISANDVSPNSVRPEVPYTVRFNFTPGRHLIGKIVEIKLQAQHIHADEEYEDREEDCALIYARIV